MVKEDMAEVEVTEEDTEDVPRIFTPSISLHAEEGCVV